MRYNVIPRGWIYSSNSGYNFILSTHFPSGKLLKKLQRNCVGHEVMPGERLDHISKVYYNNEAYWPFIALLNKKVNPWDVYAGEILLIHLSIDEVLGLLEFWQTPNQEDTIYKVI